jgi:methylthioribose-1-phosphate isomerase
LCTLVDAIQRLVVRGAPAIGAAGAYGVAIALLQGDREGWAQDRDPRAVARVREARTTAVNVMVCVDRGRRRGAVWLPAAAPTTTVDLSTPTGDAVRIDLRGEDEVLEWGGVRTAPAESRGPNPAFDVTPGRLVTALVTELSVWEVASGQLPADHLNQKEAFSAG